MIIDKRKSNIRSSRDGIRKVLSQKPSERRLGIGAVFRSNQKSPTSQIIQDKRDYWCSGWISDIRNIEGVYISYSQVGERST